MCWCRAASKGSSSEDPRRPRRQRGRVDVQRLNSSFNRADELLSGLSRASTELGGLIQTTDTGLDRVLSQSSGVLTQLQQLLVRADGATEQLARSSSELRGLLRASDVPLRATVHNLREASENFKELGRTLAQQPSSLLLSKPPHERELP